MSDYKVVDAEQLDAGLTSIADKIREQTGKTEQIPFPTGYETAPAELVEVGRQAATAVCQSKHYVTVIPGSGNDTLTFHLPFEPDMILVVGYDPTVLVKNYSVMTLVYDIAAFGLMGGLIVFSKNGAGNQTAMTTESAKPRFSRSEDGTATVRNITIGGVTGTFAENVMYSITAVKYTDKTDKERITEMVNDLTGSGSLTMNRSKVNAAFTTEEWDALIATKPDWTFVFI